MRSLFILLCVISLCRSISAQQCLSDMIAQSSPSDLPIPVDSNVVYRDDILTLQIVFHVLYHNEEEKISNAQIQNQLQRLNQNFRNQNHKFEETAEPFKALAADVEIEFCVPLIQSPDGDILEPAIQKAPTEVEEIGLTSSWFSTEAGGLDPLDNELYINVWIGGLPEGINGFATYPGTANPIQSDGIFINYREFLKEDSEILTHEMGHYLNLYHIWGRETGGCNMDDELEDTPLQAEPHDDCPVFPSYDDCTFFADGLNYNNFMDYTEDACLTMFTHGQKERMRAAIFQQRPGLISNVGCTTSVGTADIHNKALTVFPNPSQGTFYLSHPITNVKVIDHIGRVVFQYRGSEVKHIDLSSFPSGIYFLQGSDFVQKMIKL